MDREEDEAGVVDGASRLRSSTVVHVGGHALPPGQDGAAGGGRGGRWFALASSGLGVRRAGRSRESGRERGRSGRGERGVSGG